MVMRVPPSEYDDDPQQTNRLQWLNERPPNGKRFIDWTDLVFFTVVGLILWGLLGW